MKWEAFVDRSYFDMWMVRPVGERRLGCGFHLMRRDEAAGLAELLTECSAANPWKAKAIETQSAKTACGLGPKDESAVANGDLPNPNPSEPPHDRS